MRAGRGLAYICGGTWRWLVPVHTRIRARPPFARGMDKRHGTASARIAAERVSLVDALAALRDGVLGKQLADGGTRVFVTLWEWVHEGRSTARGLNEQTRPRGVQPKVAPIEDTISDPKSGLPQQADDVREEFLELGKAGDLFDLWFHQHNNEMGGEAFMGVYINFPRS